MELEYQLESDNLSLGLTRPATKLGVPFIPFFISIIACFFGWMSYQGTTNQHDLKGLFLFMFIWLVCYSVMCLITSKDIFGLTIFWINFQHFRRHKSFKFWGNTDSYQP